MTTASHVHTIDADEGAARAREVLVRRAGAAGVVADPAPDLVAVEEPLELRLAGTPLAVVMRTPGHDEDLARGFMLTEGILLRPSEIAAIEQLNASVIDVTPAPGVEVDTEQFRRNMFTSSSCGVCGKASIESLHLFARPARRFTIEASVLAGLTEELRRHQPAFDETGGLHAAGRFSLDGRALEVREDVGRHNAVDKVVGAAALASTEAGEWPLEGSLLVVSGRQSFEIVQKAAMAGIGGVVGVSAPSSLAVELAEELGMLLAGFARGDSFNVYAGAEHVAGLEG